MKKVLSYLLLIPIIATLTTLFIAPATQATPLVCNMSVVTGDDDGSFPMTLPFSLQLGNTNYNQVYYSTNGLMSFGQPDGNFWSYPSTPSVTLAGRDWVSFGPGAYTSYGYNESSFCIEWSVRPFPQSSGDLTQIRLVVNRFANGGWHGEITTLGWIPPDIRRGIVWEQGGTPLPIAAAFDVNGGVPVEVAPAPAPTSLTEPPAVPTQCWDGSTVYAPTVCPTEPSYTCWDGSTTHYASECISEPVVICWDNSQVHYQSECSPVPPDITCWDGQIVPWNGVCRQVPPPIDCWDGSSVNWDAQCPSLQENSVFGTGYEWGELTLTAPEGKVFTSVYFANYGLPINYTVNPECGVDVSQLMSTYFIGLNSGTAPVTNVDLTGDPCHGVGKHLSVILIYGDAPVIEPTPTPSVTPTVEPTPMPTEPTQIPEPTQQPTVEPSPTPTPSVSQSASPEPVVTPSVTPEPVVSSLEELPIPVETPSEDPAPNTPSDNLTTEEAVAEILAEYDSQEAVPFDVLLEAGLDYSDLPPDQPVMLENGVVLTAEVADALQVFENIDELFASVITDPGKVITALANVGADMTPQERDQSKKVVIAAVVAAQLMNGLSVANNIGRKL